MPPRKKMAAAAPTAAAAAAAAAAGPQPQQPLPALPDDVLALIAAKLIPPDEDKLYSLVQMAQSIAALAQASRALNELAKGTLWPLLAQRFAARSAAAAAGGASWEQRFVTTKLRTLDKAPTARAIRQMYQEEQAPADSVPAGLFAEVYRMRGYGIAGTNAKQEIFLTDGDLRSIHHEDRSRGALGTVHLFPLHDVVAAAAAKFGSVAGMEAAQRLKQEKSQKAKEAKHDAEGQRARGLAAALGCNLSGTMLAMQLTQDYLKGGKKAPSQEQLLPVLRLARWLQQHTDYADMRSSLVHSDGRFMTFKVHFREGGGGPSYFNDYWGKAAKAAAELSREEEEVMALACQAWAKRCGGAGAALARPEVPAEEGAPLRLGIAELLDHPVSHRTASDVGYGDEYEDYWC